MHSNDAFNVASSAFSGQFQIAGSQSTQFVIATNINATWPAGTLAVTNTFASGVTWSIDGQLLIRGSFSFNTAVAQIFAPSADISHSEGGMISVLAGGILRWDTAATHTFDSRIIRNFGTIQSGATAFSIAAKNTARIENMGSGIISAGAGGACLVDSVGSGAAVLYNYGMLRVCHSC